MIKLAFDHPLETAFVITLLGYAIAAVALAPWRPAQ